MSDTDISAIEKGCPALNVRDFVVKGSRTIHPALDTVRFISKNKSMKEKIFLSAGIPFCIFPRVAIEQAGDLQLKSILFMVKRFGWVFIRR